MRQYARMQHIWIGKDDVSALADGLASIRGRVAVVCENAEAMIEPCRKIVQLGKLILRESLGGEEIQRACVRIFQNCVQNGQVVAEGFARSRGSDNDGISPRMYSRRRGSLMAIELSNALLSVDGGEIPAHPLRHWRKLCVARRDMVHGGEYLARAIARHKLFDDFADASQGGLITRRPRR